MAAALALHQSANRAETRARTLERNWFEQNEVRSHGKGALQRCLAVACGLSIQNGNGDGAAVRGRGAGPTQHFSSNFRIRAIHDHSLEPLAGELLRRAIRIGDVLDANLHFTENAAKHTDDFVVSAKQ